MFCLKITPVQHDILCLTHDFVQHGLNFSSPPFFLKQSAMYQHRPFRAWGLFKAICYVMYQPRPFRLLYHGFDFHGGGARKRFTSCFTTSNLQFSHQTWNVSHRNYACAFTTFYHVSHYSVYTEITKITSSIDAKTEPHEGRNMASVNLPAQVQTGCVATKGTRLCLENASD